MSTKRLRGRTRANRQSAGIFLLLILLISIIPFSLTVQPVRAGDWYDANYLFRQSFVVNGTGTTAGTNYQVKITVNYGTGTSSGSTVYLNNHSKVDFTDVRFVGNDHTTVYDIWNETFTNASTADFWVEIPANLTGTTATIWVYYGYASASAVANGNNTFLLFDDFNDASYNTSKWTTNSGTPVESGGYLEVKGDDLDSVITFGSCRAITRMKPLSTNCGYQFNLRMHSDSQYGMFWETSISQKTTTHVATDENHAVTMPLGSYSRYEILYLPSTSVTFTINGSTVSTHTTQKPTSTELEVRFLSYGDNPEMDVDWVAVGKYVYPEPTLSGWTAEATDSDTTPPTFGTVSNSTHFALTPCTFSVVVYDNTAPGSVTMQHNNSGSFVNETWVSIGANGTAKNFTITLNGSAGTVLQYSFFANDSSGNMAQSTIYNLTMGADITAPTFGTPTNNSMPYAGAIINLSIPAYDNGAPYNITIQTNNTGTNTNQTWISVPANGTTMNFSITLNSTVGSLIDYKFFAYDYVGNIGVSSAYNITTIVALDGTSTVLGPTNKTGSFEISFMRNCFYANGLNWVFYSNGSGTFYQTSSNGITWLNPIKLGIGNATATGQLSVWYNGTYLSLATIYDIWEGGNKMTYRMGIPNANGTITWLAEHADLLSKTPVDISIITDSNDYPWITYRGNGDPDVNCVVTTSTTNNGTWTTKSGFPFQFLNTSSANGLPIVPLTSGKVVMFYGQNGGVVTAKQWNGTAWLSSTTTSTSAQYYWKFIPITIPDTDIVHLLMTTASDTFVDAVYNATSNTFTNETAFQSANIGHNPISGAEGDASPTVSLDPITNNLYCFWTGMDNYTYYKMYNYSSAAWDTNATQLSNETANGFTSFYTFEWSMTQPQSYYKAGSDGTIGLTYLTKQASAWDITFTFLKILDAGDTTPPTFTTVGSNTTVANDPCLFYVNWADETALSGYLLETNNTGTAVNGSFTAMTGAGNWSNATLTLNTTGGLVIQWRIFANDSSNNWNATGYQNITLTDGTYPIPSNYAHNTTVANDGVLFSVKWTDETGLSGYIFSWNNSGAWANGSYAAFSANPEWANVSQTLNATGGLVIGYRWYANDSSNNWVAGAIQSLTTTDDTLPYSSSEGANTTLANDPCLFYALMADETGLSGYIFSTNNTGAWANNTFASLAGTSAWANVTKTLNATGGLVIGYRWYFNDSSNNWNNSGIKTLTTSDDTLPTSASEGTNSTTTGDPCLFYGNWADETGLSGFIFSTNNTGVWVNNTWVVFSGTWANATKTLNSTGGLVISYRVFANDTSDNWGDSGIKTLTTTDNDKPVCTGGYLGTNGTLAGNATLFYSGGWSDNTGLSGFILETNNSGVAANQTWAAFSGAWANVTLTLNGTVGLVVQWRIFANDSSNNWNVTSMQSLTTTGTVAATLVITIDVYTLVSDVGFNTSAYSPYNGTWSDISAQLIFTASGNVVINSTNGWYLPIKSITNQLTGANLDWSYNAPPAADTISINSLAADTPVLVQFTPRGDDDDIGPPPDGNSTVYCTLNLIEQSQDGTTNPVAGVYSYQQGSYVTISAIPDEGFAPSWIGATPGSSGLQAVIFMDTNRTVTVSFALDNNGNGNGGGSNPLIDIWNNLTPIQKALVIAGIAFLLILLAIILARTMQKGGSKGSSSHSHKSKSKSKSGKSKSGRQF